MIILRTRKVRTSACLFDLNTTKHENWSVPRIYTRSNENYSSWRNFTSFLIAFTVTSFVAVKPAWVNFVVCNYVCATATSMLLGTARGIVNPRPCELTRKNSWNFPNCEGTKFPCDLSCFRGDGKNNRKNFPFGRFFILKHLQWYLWFFVCNWIDKLNDLFLLF